MPTPDVEIGRLTLRLPGGSPADGRRLAELVAAGLAAADLTGAGVSADPLSPLRVTVAAGARAPAEQLARLVVADIVRQLGRTA